MKNMRLKLARVEMNLSQEELAAKVNGDYEKISVN